MRKTGAIVATLLLGVALGGVTASPAAADSYYVRDRNDQPAGALDIRRATVGHKSGKLTNMIQLFDPFTPRNLDPQKTGYLGVAFDTNADLKADRFGFIFGGSKFRAVMVTRAGALVGRPKILRPNRRTIGIAFGASMLGSPPGYLWQPFAQTITKTKCCFDTTRRIYIHDLTAPTFTSDPTADPASATISNPNASVPVSFTAMDTGWMDVHTASIRGRTNGTSTWTTLASKRWKFRTLSNRTLPRTWTPTPPLSFVQGTTNEICASVADGAGNWTGSDPFVFQVPYDDTNTDVFTPTGTWLPVLDSADYGGSHRESSTASDTMQIVVPFGLEAKLVVPGGFTGTADVQVNGFAAGTIDENSLTGHQNFIPLPDTSHMAASGNDTIVLTVASGTFAVDGYVGAPPEQPPLVTIPKCGGRPSISGTSPTTAPFGMSTASLDELARTAFGR